MALTDYLLSQASNAFLDNDINWIQYIADHRLYLRSVAKQYSPSGEVLAQNRYNLQRWLKTLSYDPAIWWIVVRINDFNSEIDFSPDRINSVIYIPTMAQITDLYQSYLTTSSSRITDPIG